MEGHRPQEEGSCVPCSPGDVFPAIIASAVVVIVLIVLFALVNLGSRVVPLFLPFAWF